MNILLWVLQILLALHTAIGAVWKFSNPAEQTQPSLKVIPDRVWLSMSIIELLCSVGLIVPLFDNSLGIFALISAIIIAVEMLLFCGIHMYSDDDGYGSVIYWLVVAVISAFIVYGRIALIPF